MVMFIKVLGPAYTIWDKSAAIHYKKPGRSTLRAEFSIDEEDLGTIKQELEKKDWINRTYLVELRDENNRVCSLIEKTLHFRKTKHRKSGDK
jgi:hypothetical protein